ncbi:hypothetical protein PR003_g33634 [Phytophthora rubi]|uniref:Uncharacterized protein n=1 Tax=Phytophthora rubi TaxID=129364 RepID=A0A6A4AQH1_9STRA|nr:hypothetical protein PR003_g33634 [Phytophthora rubi]
MSSSPRADATRSGKRKRVETMESRKRRRRILQGESGDDDEAISSDGEDEVPTGEDVNAPGLRFVLVSTPTKIPMCARNRRTKKMQMKIAGMETGTSAR